MLCGVVLCLHAMLNTCCPCCSEGGRPDTASRRPSTAARPELHQPSHTTSASQGGVKLLDSTGATRKLCCAAAAAVGILAGMTASAAPGCHRQEAHREPTPALPVPPAARGLSGEAAEALQQQNSALQEALERTQRELEAAYRQASVVVRAASLGPASNSWGLAGQQRHHPTCTAHCGLSSPTFAPAMHATGGRL